MLSLVIFSVLLLAAVFFVEPSTLLCSTTLSVGVIGSEPSMWYALSLIVLFAALRTRLFGFVLLAPSVVSAAMTPETAVLVLVSSAVLFARRYIVWMAFVVLAALIVLVILVGVPLALLTLLVLLIPICASIPSEVWRIRAIALWFVLALVLVSLASWYVGLFSFDVFGFSMLPLEPILLVALSVQSILLLSRDTHAQLFRSLLLLFASLSFAPLSLFVVPIIVGVLASDIERSLGPERLRGSRILAFLLVLLAIIPSYGVSSDPIEVEDALVFMPDHFELACAGKTYPERLSPVSDVDELASIGDPSQIREELLDRGVLHVVFPPGFDEPIVFALRHSGAGFEERDGFIVASLS